MQYSYVSIMLYMYVCTDTQENADRAAKMVTVQYSSQSKPLLTIEDGIEANSFYSYPGDSNILNVGNANGMFTTVMIVTVCYNAQQYYA